MSSNHFGNSAARVGIFGGRYNQFDTEHETALSMLRASGGHVRNGGPLSVSHGGPVNMIWSIDPQTGHPIRKNQISSYCRQPGPACGPCTYNGPRGYDSDVAQFGLAVRGQQCRICHTWV